MLYRIIRAIVIPIVRIFHHPLVTGRENTQVEGPAIVICNHISWSDVLILAVLFKRTLHFMAKKELFKGRFLAAFFNGLQAFPVDRDAMDIASVRSALKVLKEGHIFAIFPEGTRNKGEKLLPFYKGFAYIAVKSGVPVIPVCTRKHGRRRLVRVGSPIDLNAELEGVQQHDKVDAAVELMQGRMQQVLDQITGAGDAG